MYSHYNNIIDKIFFSLPKIISRKTKGFSENEKQSENIQNYIITQKWKLSQFINNFVVV